MLYTNNPKTIDILKTKRLTLRPLTDGDFEMFYQTLIRDPIVMRFYHRYHSIKDDQQRRNMAHGDFFEHFAEGHRRCGYIVWGLWLGPTFIGWCGVTTPALSDRSLGPELQYMIASSYHGNGFAGESARAVLRDAFHRYGLSKLHAVVDTPNIASRRVLEKAGFRQNGPVEVYGSKDMLLYTHDSFVSLP